MAATRAIKNPARAAKIARGIKLLILDVDGVLTDGGIIYDGGTDELKMFNVRDGHGLVMLRNAGVKIAIISGRASRAVDRRAKELGITDVCQKCTDKIAAYDKLLAAYGLEDGEVAFMGDDVVDIPLLRKVGLPAAPADAIKEVKETVIFIASSGGGKGAVREVCDLILKSGGKWNEAAGL